MVGFIVVGQASFLILKLAIYFHSSNFSFMTNFSYFCLSSISSVSPSKTFPFSATALSAGGGH